MLDDFGFFALSILKSSTPSFAIAIPLLILFFFIPLFLAWGRYLFGQKFMTFFADESLPIDSMKRFIFAALILCVLLLFIPFLAPFSSNIVATILFTLILLLWWTLVNQGFKAFGLKKGSLISLSLFFVFFGDALITDSLRLYNRAHPTIEIYDADEAMGILAMVKERDLRRFASARWGEPFEFPMRNGKILSLSGRRPVFLYHYYVYVAPPEYTRFYSISQVSNYVCFFKTSTDKPIFCYQLKDVYGSWMGSVLPPFLFKLAQ